MALGWNEGGEQTAPLGRAVIGGLAAATLATLVVLPTVFAIDPGSAGRRSASIDPADSESSVLRARALERCQTRRGSRANGDATGHKLTLTP